MQNLDLKYLHKKKLCINPFRWWQSWAGCHRGQRVPTSSLLKSPSEPCIKIFLSSLISVYTVSFKDDKASSHSKTGHGREVHQGAEKRVKSSSVCHRCLRKPGSGLFTGCFWLWHVWGCETSSWWTAQTFCCSRQRDTRTGDLQCECVHVCAS